MESLFWNFISLKEKGEGFQIQLQRERERAHLGEMPILGVDRMGRRTKDALLSLYDKEVNGKKISESALKSLPEEFANPVVRKEIDEETCRALGLDLKLDTLYKLLAKEPMITG